MTMKAQQRPDDRAVGRGKRHWRTAAGQVAGAVITCVAMLLLALPGLAGAATTPGAQAQLQSFVDRVQSATGHFQQAVTGVEGAAQRVQSGDFAFQRPGKFRWQVRQPYAQLIVSDGEHVYQYDPDLDQVTERRADQAVGASPAALLFGSGSLDKAFDLQAQPPHDGLQWLRATPKTPEAGFVHVDIGFIDGLPRRLDLLDAFGQTSRITFSDLKANPQIPAAQFRFTVPQGADLVKMN